MRERGLTLPPEVSAHTRLARDATRVVARAYEIDRARWQSDYGGDQGPPAWIDREYPRAPALVRSWAGELSQVEVDFLARPISDIAEEYIRHRLRHARSRKTERDWYMAVRYFIGLCGDLRAGEITARHVDDFRRKLLDMPSEYGKGIFADITPAEAPTKLKELDDQIRFAQAAGAAEIRIDRHRIPLDKAKCKLARMTMKTANKHLSLFTALWRSRVVPRIVQPMNPFAGSLYLKGQVRTDPACVIRTPYTTDELQRLFRSPAWTGCASIRRRCKKGPYIFPDARFWVPLIAAFTGMRREEICQLKSDDFDRHGRIWFVRVQPTEGRHLKTAASARAIPLHSELIKIGLAEFVEYRRNARSLFPELVASVVDGARGDPLGKWFNYYRHHIEETVPREEIDLHAFRTTFAQRLRDAGVPLDQIRPITGHLETDVTSVHYARELPLLQKKKIVEKLDLAVDFGHLHGQMLTLLPLLKIVDQTASAKIRRRTRALRRTKSRDKFAAPPQAAE